MIDDVQRLILQYLPLILIGVLVFLFARGRGRAKLDGDRTGAGLNVPHKPPMQDDPFMMRICEARERARERIERAEVGAEADEAALATRIDGDEALRKRLVAFARGQGLDQALILLWTELSQYPRLGRDNLPGEEVLGMRERQVEEGCVSFVVDSGRFALKWQEHFNAKISFFENEEEMFAVTAKQAGRLRDILLPRYACESIDALRRRGAWATVLLDLSAAVVIEQHRRSLRFCRDETENAPKKFEE